MDYSNPTISSFFNPTTSLHPTIFKLKTHLVVHKQQYNQLIQIAQLVIVCNPDSYTLVPLSYSYNPYEIQIGPHHKPYGDVLA
jgi:hypothetical protein